MQVQLELPEFPARLGWETSLSDENFERAAMESEWVQLERSKEGDLIVNAASGGFTGHGNSEITHQLHAWWKTHKRGRVFDSNTGFFLGDGSSYAPDTAYATPEQLVGLTRKQLARFPRLCPAFVIELVSRTDRRKAVQSKMLDWMANGAQLAWLIDPYQKSVTIYEPAKPSVTVTTEIVSGPGPIADSSSTPPTSGAATRSSSSTDQHPTSNPCLHIDRANDWVPLALPRRHFPTSRPPQKL